MAIILHIDTAVELASICLAKDGRMLGYRVNEQPREHSSWLHKTILELLEEAGYRINLIDAVAVTVGPGSYTGLRVGLSAAKGICFTLSKPLIAVNTLELLASTVHGFDVDFICPMIDARRMEVFTALYSIDKKEVQPPGALILDEHSFNELLKDKKLVFAGNGSEKFRKIISHSNAFFTDKMPTAADMIDLSLERFKKGQFSDVAYLEPLYVKEFYQPNR